ncbi:MAG TPA: hypothetical protein VF952_00620 [Chloroflexia bacterium]
MAFTADLTPLVAAPQDRESVIRERWEQFGPWAQGPSTQDTAL